MHPPVRHVYTHLGAVLIFLAAKAVPRTVRARSLNQPAPIRFSIQPLVPSQCVATPDRHHHLLHQPPPCLQHQHAQSVIRVTPPPLVTGCCSYLP